MEVTLRTSICHKHLYRFIEKDGTHRGTDSSRDCDRELVRPAGFEPTTPAFGGQYSIQLSYGRMHGRAWCLAEGRHGGERSIADGRGRRDGSAG